MTLLLITKEIRISKIKSHKPKKKVKVKCPEAKSLTQETVKTKVKCPESKSLTQETLSSSAISETASPSRRFINTSAMNKMKTRKNTFLV